MRNSRKQLKKLAQQLEAQQSYRELQDDLQRLAQRCQGKRADGSPCQAQPLAGGYYCKAHAPK